MKPFKNLIEFVSKHNIHFYNRDIKCPVCGETMWVGDNYIDSVSENSKILCLACKNECCIMEIQYKDFILWDDKL